MKRHKLPWLKAFLPLVILWLACPGVKAASPDFTISLNPTSLTITQGSSGAIQLTVTPKNGFSGKVSLSLLKSDGSAAPAGITLRPTSFDVKGSRPVTQNLTISVSSGVRAGTYDLKVRAKGGKITKEARLKLTVKSGPDFTISLSPTSLTIVQGGSGTTTVVLTRKNGFSDMVDLDLVNLPAGVDFSLEDSSEATATLVIYTTADTPVGQHTLTLEATSGSIRKTVTLTLTVKQAPTFTVNTTDDTIDAIPGDGTCADSNGNCSLRAAVMEANALKGPAVIVIPAGTYKLTRTSSLDEQGGDLDIKSNVTFRGAGAGQTILDGNGADRVLEIYAGKTVRVEGVTIQNGKTDGFGGGIYNAGTLTLTDSTVSGNKANRSGGGIYNEERATLTLTDSTVSGNTANDGSGGGIYNAGTLTLTNSVVSENTVNYYYGGGGISNSGTLTLTNSTVSGNRAIRGGGIDNEERAVLTLTNSTVSGNTANDGSGGGIYNAGTLTLTGSTVSGNTANNGGGIYNLLGTLTLTGSTVSGNTANNGGGIYSLGTLTLTNSTVSGNKAKYGSGVYVEESIANLSFSTLTLNWATGKDSEGGGIYIASGTVKLKGVILAGNTSESGSGPECSGSLTSGGYNLIGSNADCELTVQKTDILGKGPALGPLAAGGGPTQTHLPQANSPVLDKVPSKDCTTLDGTALTTDQRGVKRPQGAACDIGAVERKPSE